MTKKQQPENENSNLDFQEVQVYRNDPTHDKDGNLVETFDRIKVLRPSVKIRRAEADILNSGRKEHRDNRMFTLHLLPGEEIEPHIVVKKGQVVNVTGAKY